MEEPGDGPNSESACDRVLGETAVVSSSLSVTSYGAKAPFENMLRLKGKILVARKADTIFDALNFSRKGTLLSGANL